MENKSKIILDKEPNRMDLSQAAGIMGRIGGSRKTLAKAKASRENGKKGGRPKKEY